MALSSFCIAFLQFQSNFSYSFKSTVLPRVPSIFHRMLDTSEFYRSFTQRHTNGDYDLFGTRYIVCMTVMFND